MTLDELAKDFGINPDEDLEKTASENNEALELNNELGGNMSLQDLYNETLGDEGYEKIAEAEAYEFHEMEKIASEQRAYGKFMAHGFADELEKIAEEKEIAQMAADEKLPTQLDAEGAMGTKIGDKGMLRVNTSEARNANSDALKEKKINRIMGKGEKVDSDSALGEDHLVAKDAN